MQAPHNWTVRAMWSQHQGGDGSQAQFSAAWVREGCLCDPYPASLRRHVSQSPSLMVINWTQETIQVFVWQRIMQQSNVNRLQPHQNTSDHFPDATNKGTHSLLVPHTMTTKAIPSFLLRDASRYWQKLKSVFLRLLWFSTLSKQDTI